MFPAQFEHPAFGGPAFGNPAQQIPPPFGLPRSASAAQFQGRPCIAPILNHFPPPPFGPGLPSPRQRRRASFAAPGFARPPFPMGMPGPPPGFGVIPGFCGPAGGGMPGPLPGFGPMPGGFRRGGMPMPAPEQRGPPGRDFDPSRWQPRSRTPSRGRSRSSSTRRPSFAGRRPDEIFEFGSQDPPDTLLRNNGKSPRRRRAFDPSRSPKLRGGLSPNRPPSDRHEDRMRTALNDGDVMIIGGYRRIKSLARGGMSTAINLVKSQRDGKLYIEKRIRVDGYHRPRAVAELLALELVNKQYGVGGNLNTMVEYKISDHRQLASLILDYCDNGSLEDRMKEVSKSGGYFSEAGVWNIMQGVACGLAFLHDGITDITVGHHSPKPKDWDTMCHLDLKPCNIFLHSSGGISGQTKVVLADFGCAVTLSDIEGGREGAIRQPCSTPAWYPPEGDVRKPKSYGTKTDMWQLGATIHVLCRMFNPVIPDRRVLYSGRPIGSRYGERLRTMVVMLTEQDPMKRPAARDVAPEAMKVMREKLGGGSRRESKRY